MRGADQNPAGRRHRARPLLSCRRRAALPAPLRLALARARLVRGAARRSATPAPPPTPPCAERALVRRGPLPAARHPRRRRPTRSGWCWRRPTWRSSPRAGRAAAGPTCRTRSRSAGAAERHGGDALPLRGAPGATTPRCRARSSCSSRSRARRPRSAPSTSRWRASWSPGSPRSCSWGAAAAARGAAQVAERCARAACAPPLRVDVTPLVRAWARRDADDHGIALLASGDDAYGAVVSTGVSRGHRPAARGLREVSGPRSRCSRAIRDLVDSRSPPRGARCAPSTACRSTCPRGRAVALVGESGCGKSVTAQAILRLLPDAARARRRGCRSCFEGRDLLDAPGARDAGGARRASGDGLPGADDLAEPGVHGGLPDHGGDRACTATCRGARRGGSRSRGSRASASPSRRGAWTATRTSSRAACASACSSRSRSRAARRCSSPTSRPPRSTRPCRRRSSTLLADLRRRDGDEPPPHRARPRAGRRGRRRDRRALRRASSSSAGPRARCSARPRTRTRARSSRSVPPRTHRVRGQKRPPAPDARGHRCPTSASPPLRLPLPRALPRGDRSLPRGGARARRRGRGAAARCFLARAARRGARRGAA